MKIIELENLDGTTTEHVIIDRGNGEFTSMTKAHYDELQARDQQSATAGLPLNQDLTQQNTPLGGTN